MQGAMGLDRKDGNTGSFHKNVWIPAPASPRTCFCGNDRVGVRGNDDVTFHGGQGYLDPEVFLQEVIHNS